VLILRWGRKKKEKKKQIAVINLIHHQTTSDWFVTMVHTDHNLQPQDCQEAPTQGCVVSDWLVTMESLLALTGGILRRTAQFHRRIPQILSSDRYHRTPSGRPPGFPNRLLDLFFSFPLDSLSSRRDWRSQCLFWQQEQDQLDRYSRWHPQRRVVPD